MLCVVHRQSSKRPEKGKAA